MQHTKKLTLCLLLILSAFSLSPAHALLIGEGESAEIEWDISGEGITDPFGVTFGLFNVFLTDGWDTDEQITLTWYDDAGNNLFGDFEYTAPRDFSNSVTLASSREDSTVTSGSIILQMISGAIDVDEDEVRVGFISGGRWQYVAASYVDNPAPDTSVPEPNTAMMLLLGLACLIARIRGRQLTLAWRNLRALRQRGPATMSGG